MVLLLGFAFVSGLLTIAAPCIWPLLPIVLSSTTTGGHKKPFGVTLGIVISFAVFTLTLSYIVKIIPLNLDGLRLFAVVIITFFGLTLIFPKLSQIVEGWVSSLSGKVVKPTQGTGFVSGLLTGFSLGIIWSPCAGPILATVAALAATRAVSFDVVLVTIAYVTGVGIPLFLFATLGRTLFTKSRLLSKYTGRIQQVFGVIMVLTAIVIATNYDKTLQANLLDKFPSYSNFLNQFETDNTVKEQLDRLKGSGKQNLQSGNSDLFNAYTKAPEFVGISKWLNTEKPLTIKELHGKVVLIDFWTYTCINCIRTLPHVTSWYNTYKDEGFVVIGVHTPEFEFEKKTENVEQAIKQYGILYPVAQDNDYATWNAYNNHYWPAKYLIDKDGRIRYTHFGEGKYEETEEKIRELLKEAGKKVTTTKDTMPDKTPRIQLSPETYLGSNRMQYYYPNGSIEKGTYALQLEKGIPPNSFSYGGNWIVGDEHAKPSGNAVLEINFTASRVFLVMRPTEKGKVGKVNVLLDGKIVDSLNAGADVENGTIIVDQDRLYTVIDLKGSVENHILRLEFETPTIEIYAFTFG